MSSGLLLFALLGALSLWAHLPSASSQFQDPCGHFPREKDHCGEPKPRFFFNGSSKACEPFLSRGCPWNLNRFHTVEECRRHCAKIKKAGFCPPSPTGFTTECLTHCIHDGGCPGAQKCCSYGCALRCSDPVKDLCQLPPEAGPCGAKLQRWYFDGATKSCKRFTFGGCLGNKNNFQKRKECRQRCLQRASGQR
ncbi:BPTI/Kunitz domain-containing protein [Anolis carolinensis]|uniref:BPTI/Kunitz domain-containing protein n=1 Tax=Anolis carolinensis TaxID=28377 RepID=UPI0004627636|nr:PREDICTED: BPTI/Kunitz domain-containing protein [Anolis carolinensis]|eukprot:XP_008121978.1 PREDICTED: BPTI/Kunitz domain-containing protein [Anolis carolinensis]